MLSSTDLFGLTPLGDHTNQQHTPFMSSENFIVRARCFLASEKLNRESLKNLNYRIVALMERKGYESFDTTQRDLIIRDQVFLTLIFDRTVDRSRVPVSSRVKRGIGLKSNSEILSDLYFKDLRNTIDHVPHRVTFTIDYVEIEKSRGFSIWIESEPTILAKHRQLKKSLEVDKSQHKEIVAYNVTYLRNMMSSLGARVLDDPMALEPNLSPEASPLIGSGFLETLPSDVAECLQEANSCFEFKCFAACSVMVRKALEIAVTKKFLQTDKESRLYDKEGIEVSLAAKIERLIELIPRIRRDADDVRIVKWFGDKGAHDPRAPIFADDIRDNVAPKVRSFLTSLELKK